MAPDDDLTDLHMLVLSYFRHRGAAWPEQAAQALGVGVDLVLRLLGELEAAGLIARSPGH